MDSNKVLKALEDKCRLQEQLNAKNEIIAQLQSQISILTASRKLKRRVSFSDLESALDEDDRLQFRSTIINAKSLSASRSSRWIHSGAKDFKNISIDGKKSSIPKSKRLSKTNLKRSSEGSDNERVPYETKVEEMEGNPNENISLRSIIEDRHRGSWGGMTSHQKISLYNATTAFLKSNNLSVGDKLQKLEMPRAFKVIFDEYLDFVIDQDIFASSRSKNKEDKISDEQIFNDALIRLKKRHQVDRANSLAKKESTKRISFGKSEDSEMLSLSSRKKRKTSPKHLNGPKKSNFSNLRNTKKISSDNSDLKSAKIHAKANQGRNSLLVASVTEKSLKAKKASATKLKSSKYEKHHVDLSSLFSWFSS